MVYLGDVSHPETPVAGQPSRVQVAEVVAINADDGTIDASPLNGRATKAHVPYPTWWVPQMGERCLIADRDGDPRQPVCLGFLAPADGSNAGPQIQGTVAAASLPKASATALGITKLSVAPASAPNPIAVGDNDTRVPTQSENDALQGTSGAPSSSNKYVTDSDTRVPTAGEAAALLGTFGTPGSGNKYVTDSDPRNSDSRAPTGAASGDLAGTYPSPTVAKLSATATRFGTGGELLSAAADYAAYSANYNSVTDRLIDTSKPGWRFSLGVSADKVTPQRAPATAGAPAFADVLTADNAKLVTFPGGFFAPPNTRFGLTGGVAYESAIPATGLTFFNRLLVTDANSNFGIFGDGRIVWGAGGASAADAMMDRPGTNALRLSASTTPGTNERLRINATGVGVFGVTPAARPAAYTQTYATATRTHSNPVAAAVSATGATQATPWGYTTQAQADAIVAAINNLVTDVANVKQVLNSVIDDHQAYGWLQ